jgi:hypothetical protein
MSNRKWAKPDLRRGAVLHGGTPLAVMALVSIMVASSIVMTIGDTARAAGGVVHRPVGRAACGPGSNPETGLQGQVTKADRVSGRSQFGYRCNLDLVGRYQGDGGSFQSAWYGHCAYYGTALGGPVRNPGVQVLDVSDPTRPRVNTRLVSPAMTEPWESLKVHQGRGLLGAVHGALVNGPVFFDVYDLQSDCTAPRLLSSLPLPGNIVGHEGTWAPDGRTYWVGIGGNGLAAIDVTDPARTRLVYFDDSRVHGLSISADGNTAYLAVMSISDGEPNGLRILDVSDVQARRPVPRTRTVSTLYWADGAIAQLTIPVTYAQRPFLFFTDEGGSRYADRSEGAAGFRSPAGAVRLIDISDVRRPQVVSKIKLEIQMPEHQRAARDDTNGNGLWGYQAHYCTVDRETDPTALACSYFQSGIRVFDVRNPYESREIAYFNPPAQTGKHAELPGSWHVSSPVAPAYNLAFNQDPVATPDLSADWCTAQVRFYAPRNELWTHCMDNGFLVLNFSNGAYPLPPLTAPPVPPARSEAVEISARPVAEPEGSGRVASARPAERPPSALTANRLQLAYRCIVAPQLDEGGIDRLFTEVLGRQRRSAP